MRSLVTVISTYQPTRLTNLFCFVTWSVKLNLVNTFCPSFYPSCIYSFYPHIYPQTGQLVQLETFTWNATVANLTLMALGSSAPEISLAIIEILVSVCVRRCVLCIFYFIFYFLIFILCFRRGVYV